MSNINTNITMSSQLDPVYLYELWLSGKSLRTIGRMVGVGRMAVYGSLSRKYGKDCCALRKQSLARIVYQEYGNMDLAIKARGIEGLYRSEKTENNYSEHQGYELATKNLRAATVDSPDSLTLPLYYKALQITTLIIYLAMWSRVNRSSLAYCPLTASA
jgi:hypothetical protein